MRVLPQVLRRVHAVALLFTISVSGCTSMYFRTLNEVPTLEPSQPSNWPWDEYWTGIVFNGKKIGFTHQQFVPDQDRFRISSEAALRLRFLIIDKQFAATTHDWVDAGLQLQNFEYAYKIDNSRRIVKGEVHASELSVEVSTQDQTDSRVLHFEGELVPMSAIYLYPVLHGLQVGKVYNYQVFDGESLAIHPVEQTIVAYQSSELFDDKAFKLETKVMGLSTTTWLDASGLPQFELSLNGVLISALEPEQYAKEYLTQAALSKSEQFLTYSLIPVRDEIQNPRRQMLLHVRLSGVPETFALMDTSMQQCRKQDSAWICRIENDQRATDNVQALPAGNTVYHLLPSFTVNSTAERIVNLAHEIAPASAQPNDQVQHILEWMDENIEKAIVDSFNSLDVLSQGKAECQGHSMLYAALARSLGIPTRLLNGVVYSEDYKAFVYHTWVESYIDNRWQALDPTFGQRYADATHIALIEGEELADLTALLPLIGRLQIELY